MRTRCFSSYERWSVDFSKGAWRLKEDLLHTIVAQDDDHEIDMVAFLHQTSADSFARGGFLRDGHSVRHLLSHRFQSNDIFPFFHFKLVQ